MSCNCHETSGINTAQDWLLSCVNFEIPSSASQAILLGRGLEGSEDCSMLDKKTRDLLKADLYVWICMGASKVDSVSDSDNGWSHKGGGYTLSEADKRRMLDWANDIYDEYDEPLVGKKNAIVMISNGIRRAHETFCGDPLPRIQKGR